MTGGFRDEEHQGREALVPSWMLIGMPGQVLFHAP